MFSLVRIRVEPRIFSSREIFSHGIFQFKKVILVNKRKVFAVICYIISLACLGCCGYITYITYTSVLSELQGFLTFVLFWIGSYWFSTFFSQLSLKKGKDGKKIRFIGKKTRRFMGDVLTILSVALICFWAYMYVTRYTNLLSFLNEK